MVGSQILGSIVIPPILQDKKFNFVLLPKAQKKAFELAWDKKNYTYDNPKLLEHIRSQYNYGIIAGHGDLCIIDIDDLTIIKEVEKQLNTFTVKTGKGGRHFYIKCEYKTNHVFKDKKGEYRAHNYYVVGPTCTHPNGNQYTIIKNTPIQTLTEEQLAKIITPYLRPKPGEDTPTQSTTTGDTSRSGKEFGEVIKQIKQGNSKEDIFNNMMSSPKWQTAHPAYREITYQKAYDIVDQEYKQQKEEEITKETKQEFGELIKQIKKGKPKTKIYKHMESYPHWEKSEDIYKDTAYQSALNTYEKEQATYSDALKKLNIAKDSDQKTILKLKNDILTLLLLKQKSEASELISKHIIQNNTIYTLRDDEKPEMWIYADGIYIPQGQTYIQEAIYDLVGEKFATQLTNEVIAKISVQTYTDPQKFFEVTDIDHLAILNGILNLKTRELTPFTSNKIFFNKIPVTYDTQQTCPNIIKHFEEVLKYETDIQVMQELFGFLLWREYTIENAFMFIGAGRNGKGKTIEIMKLFIGPQNCTNLPLQNIDSSPFAMEGMHNMMANLCADISNAALNETANFKLLTGRDLITADRKYKTKISFTNFAKMIFAANEIPRTKDQSIAFWERWKIIEFPNTFVTQEEINKLDPEERQTYKVIDPEHVAKLNTPEEMSGLLNWALDGLDRLLKQKRFSTSKSSKDTQKIWNRMSDPFTAFITDECEEDYAYEVAKKEMNATYTKYCIKHKLHPKSQKIIKHILESRGIEDRRSAETDSEGNRPRVWVGIKLKSSKNEEKNHKSVQDVQPNTKITESIIHYNTEKFSKKAVSLDKLDKREGIGEKVQKSLVDIGEKVPKKVPVEMEVMADNSLNQVNMVNVRPSDPVKLGRDDLLLILDERKDPADIENLVSKFGDSVYDLIKILKLEGLVFEPRSGFVSVVR